MSILSDCFCKEMSKKYLNTDDLEKELVDVYPEVISLLKDVLKGEKLVPISISTIKVPDLCFLEYDIDTLRVQEDTDKTITIRVGTKKYTDAYGECVWSHENGKNWVCFSN